MNLLFENNSANKDLPEISQPTFMGSTVTQPCTPLTARLGPTRPAPPVSRTFIMMQPVYYHLKVKNSFLTEWNVVFSPIWDLWVWNKIENRVSIKFILRSHTFVFVHKIWLPLQLILDRNAHLDEKRPSCQHVMLPVPVCTCHSGLGKSKMIHKIIIDWHGKTCPNMWMEFLFVQKF